MPIAAKTHQPGHPQPGHPQPGHPQHCHAQDGALGASNGLDALTLSAMSAAMNGNTTTQGWDAVCSYDVTQLNNLLKDSYDKGALTQTVSLSTTYKDPFSGTYTVDYALKFGAPSIQFATTNGTVIFTMPFLDGSTYTITPPPTGTTGSGSIPATYSIQATVPLAAVSGSDSTSTPALAGTVITFAAGGPEQYHIVLHFKNQDGATFELSPTPSDIDAILTLMLTVLQEYFQTKVSEIDYALSGINNTPPAGGATILTPQSFVFATWGNSDGTANSGGLSLYIQTNSGNPQGIATPVFEVYPNNTPEAIQPIPTGYTASLILSHNLLTKGYLIPQLQNSGFTATEQPVTAGLQFQLAHAGNIVVNSGSGTDNTYGVWTCPEVDINLTSNPMTMVIQNSQMGLQWSWNSSTEERWASSITTWVAGREQHKNYYGTLNMTITLNKAISLTLSDTDITIANVQLGTTDFSITLQPVSCGWWDKFNNGCIDSWEPSYYSYLPLQVPSINVNISDLDFFATTNLLMPGQHMITFDPQAGVQTPHDFLLVGQVSAAS